MKGKAPDIALKTKTPHFEALLDRLASNLDGVLCSTLKRYHQFVDSKPTGRRYSILDVLTNCRKQGINLIPPGLPCLSSCPLGIDLEEAMYLFPAILCHAVSESSHTRYS